MFKVFLVLATLISGTGFFSANLDQPAHQTNNGKEVYLLNCQSCHMEKGEGIPGLYPPVAKTTYVKDTKKMIDIILNGQSGEIVVNGKKYNTDMPAMAYLTDQQVADVLNYIRNNWGNKYPKITPAQVKAQRKK